MKKSALANANKKLKVQLRCLISTITVYDSPIYEPCYEKKTAFCICKNKDADQLCGNPEADQRICFCYRDVTFFFLNPEFQASRHHLQLYSPVCVGPGRKSQRQVFSRLGSYLVFICTKGQVSCLCSSAGLFNLSNLVPRL